MAITLDDVVLEQMQTNEHLVKMHESQDIQILLQGAGVELQTSILSQMLQLMKTEARLAEEARREAARRATENPFVTDDEGSGSNLPIPEPEDSSNLLKAGIFSVTALATKEFVYGFAGAIKRDFDKIRAREFPKLLKPLNADLLKPFKDFNAAVKDLYKRRGTDQFNLKTLKTLGAENTKRLQSFFDGIKRIETRLSGFFRALRPDFLFDMIDDIKAAGTRMSDFFTNNRLVQGVRSIFSGTGMTRFMSALGGFFNLLGRIAYPLLLGWEILTGAKKELDTLGEDANLVERTLAVLTGFGKGVVRFVFGIFDLVKDITSWVAEKVFGAFEFSKMLDSFSFAEGAVDIFFGDWTEKVGNWIGGFIFDMVQGFKAVQDQIGIVVGGWVFNTVEYFKTIPESISTMFDNLGIKIGGLIFDLVEWFKSIPEQIGDVWNSLPSLSDIGNLISNAARALVRAILPPADFATFEVPKLETWFGTVGGGSINFNPIPDALYEWANTESPTATATATPAPAARIPQLETAQAITKNIEGDQNSTSEVINNVANEVGADSVVVAGNDDGGIFARLAEKFQATFGDDLNSQSMEVVASATATPPIIIQDNSVNSSNQSNLSQSVSTGSVRSPVNDNRTRASAYATT